MSQKPKIILGVLFLAASFVGLAYLGKSLHTNEPAKKQFGAVSITLDQIGKASECIEEAVDISSRCGRRVSLVLVTPERRVAVIVDPTDSVEAVRQRCEANGINP